MGGKMEFTTLQWAVLIVHAVVTIALIIIVLLQADKGEGLSGAFGGGAAQTIFGTKGSLDFFGKLTTILAIVFIITSLTLTYMAGKGFKSTPNLAPQSAQTQNK
jgi:preprotein translocase subunit SecG